MSFKAVTFNILADAYIKPDRYPDSPLESLEPTARRSLLTEVIAGMEADLYMLQEVERGAFEAIHARLGSDHFQALWCPKRRRQEGSALMVRRSAFEVLDARPLDFEGDREGAQVSAVARLRQGDRALTVVGTHLRWQADSTPAAAHLGRLQLLGVLDHLADVAPDDPWIVGGDFNATPQSSVVAAATDRGLRESCREQRPWDTCNANRRPRKLDYLLYTPAHLHPTPGSLPRLERDTPMPSLTWPSDHLAVEVRFAWK
jgi:mRNA deadenylase 3'-5' endonuclease subunit Ccr4